MVEFHILVANTSPVLVARSWFANASSVLVARFAPHLIASALLSFFKNICGINKHHRNKGLKFFHGK